MEDHQTPLGDDEQRAKYTQDEVNAMGEKGHAFKNQDGHFSYPIEDLEDLRNAIHAVGRGNADHDALRKYIISRAGALSATDEIPDNWNPDGSLGEQKSKRNPALPSRPRSVDPELRAVRDGMRGDREVRAMPGGTEMRSVPRDDGNGEWIVSEGYFSLSCADMNDDSNAYEMEDAFGPWVESTVRGFATKTIREGCDTAYLVNHAGVTMARTKAGTLDLEERLDGGFYRGRLNPTRPDVQIIRAAVQDGAVDESSFAFRVTRQRWSDDYTRRWIQEIDLNKGDVSPVNYGANPHTGGHLSMRSALALLTSQGLTARAWALALKEIRAGRTISQATLETLQPIHDYLAQGGDHADSLAVLLGLDGDDEDGDGSEDRSAVVVPLVLPDHSAAAKAALARARR